MFQTMRIPSSNAADPNPSLRTCSFRWFWNHATGFFCGVMVILSATAQTPAQEAPDVTPDLLNQARKHIADSTPKGLSGLKEAKIATRLDNGIRSIEFTVDLECDEPRYTIREIQVGKRPLTTEIIRKLKAESLETRFLTKIYEKGDALPVVGSFAVRTDGTMGAIKAFASEKMGYLRKDQVGLPLEGDTRHLAAKAAVEEYYQDQARIASQRTEATLNSLVGGVRQISGAIATSVTNPDIKGAAGILTNLLGVPSGGVAPAATKSPTPTPAAGNPAPSASPAAATPAPSTTPAPSVAPVATAPTPSPAPSKNPSSAPASIPANLGTPTGVPSLNDPATPKSVTQPATTNAPVNPVPAPGTVLSRKDSEWLTPAEAAAVLKISESEVLSAIEKGEIRAKKIGPVYRIPAKELE